MIIPTGGFPLVGACKLIIYAFAHRPLLSSLYMFCIFDDLQFLNRENKIPNLPEFYFWDA